VSRVREATALSVFVALFSFGVCAADFGLASGAPALTPKPSYCAKFHPGYWYIVYWGHPPAFYCTDDLANPSKSIPVDIAAVCAYEGLPLRTNRLGCGKTYGSTTTKKTPDTGLKVALKVFGSGESGLSFEKTEKKPVFFTSTNPDLPPKCVSGCANVQVTVRYANGKLATGATLSATVTPVPPGGIAPYPSGENAGSGHLCKVTTSTSTGCGSDVTALTDPNGQAAFLYWAPGVISPHNVKITVTARASNGKSGMTDWARTVSPYVIWKKDVVLPSEYTDAVGEWAKPKGVLASAAGLAAGPFQKLLTGALAVAGHGAGPLNVLFTATDLTSAYGQERAFMALFMEKFEFLPFSIGTKADAYGVDASFVHAWSGRRTLVDGFSSGLLYQYGQTLEGLAEQNIIHSKQLMKLRVYEVSYCQLNAVCGPAENAPGIQPFLYFTFQAGDPPGVYPGKFPLFEGSFILPYNPSKWMREQLG
jgi:hypothetical protein